MEQRSTDVEQLERRHHVAAFIASSLQPAAHAMNDYPDEAETPQFEIREYQLNAWGALWDARQRGETSALVTLATGLGKTSVGVIDVIKFREEFKADHGREPKILFTCHQDEILNQAAERFAQFAPDMTQGDYKSGDKTVTADITFDTLQKLTGNLGNLAPDTFDYIIYDEAHHAQAETFKRVVDHFTPAFQLAITATPDRADNQDIRDLFGEAVYEKSLAEAMAEGWLADIDYRIVFDEVLQAAMESGFDVKTIQELKAMFEIKPRNEIIADNVLKKRHEIGLDTAKTIVFCENQAHADEMAALLGGRAYHSNVDKDERTKIMQDFRNNGLQTICTVDMFNEGVDVPDARLIVFLRSTQSKTIFEQQLGRGLRKSDTKLLVSVLDFVGNIERIQWVKELGDSIKEYAERAERTEQADADSQASSLNVRSHHGDFTFDDMIVNILERYNLLAVESVKEGEMSILDFAALAGTTYITVVQKIKEHKIEIVTRKFGDGPGGKAVTEAGVKQLLELPQFKFIRPLPGERSNTAFSKEERIGYKTVLRIIDEYGIPTIQRRFRKVGTGLTTEAQAQVKAIYEAERIAPIASSDEVSVKALSEQMGVSKDRLMKIIEANNVPSAVRLFRNQPAASVSRGSLVRLLALPEMNIPDVQDGEMTLAALSKASGLADSKLSRFCNENGFTIVRRWSKSYETDAIGGEDLKIMLAIPEVREKLAAKATKTSNDLQ